MLRLPEFRYVAPRSLDEAMRLVEESGPEGAVMAGGTDLLPRLKRRQHLPGTIIGLRRVPELGGIRGTRHRGLTIGAGCTLADLGRHEEIAQGYPALRHALGQIATPAIREMGTIGGNLLIDTRCACFDLPGHTRDALGHCLKDGGSICLVAPRSPRCWATASSDLAPVLIALAARVRLRSPAGERVIPVEALYRDDGLHPLTRRPGEILTEVLLPPDGEVHAVYRKVRRRGAIDFPLLGVAVAVQRAADGRVTQARIVLGAVASAPLSAGEAAQFLVGRPLDPPTVSAAAELAGRRARPLENADLSAAWRKHMVRITVARALEAIAGPENAAKIGSAPDTLPGDVGVQVRANP